jgi:arsenate reductase
LPTPTAASDADQVTVFHNPGCSKSRGALELLEERSVDHTVVEYLVTPPSRQTLETIIAKLVDPVPDLVRTTDPRFTELGLDPGSYSTPEAVIELLLTHPELMERPVVVKGDRAVIARPSARVTEVLVSRGGLRFPPDQDAGAPSPRSMKPQISSATTEGGSGSGSPARTEMAP